MCTTCEQCTCTHPRKLHQRLIVPRCIGYMWKLVAAGVLLIGCGHEANTTPIEPFNVQQEMTMTEIPEYLQRWPGLYMREGDRIVEALPADVAVAQVYPTWKDKGIVVDGRRLTIMTAKTTYHVNEEIRVIHVLDAPESGLEVYVMGPKMVYGEYVDDKLATKPVPMGENPFIPATYNGRVLSSPVVDYNYEITTYTFSEPGTHQIYWQLGTVKSNMLTLEIVP
ncbi:hypothetical protein TFLX_03019 [Thermoflexales bacterium]|nr:hypothetical protein TFLX_03019 [Thermoflexales bacterium]